MLGVLLVSSIAGVIVHIPAGIGVLEAVFIALLGGGACFSGDDYRRPAGLPRALFYSAAAAGAGLLSGAGEPGEKHLRQKNERKMAAR